MKDRHRSFNARLTPVIAAAVLALAVMLPAWAQETFEQSGVVTAVNSLQQRMTLRVWVDERHVERTYTLPPEVYRNARDSDDRPVTLRPGHVVGISGFYRGDSAVIDNVWVRGWEVPTEPSAEP